MLYSRIASILNSVRAGVTPVRVQGATASARAFMVVRYHLEFQRPLVILCANDDIASDFAADLESVGSLFFQDSLLVCQIPTWEQSPYSPIEPSIRTRFARLSGLSALADGAPGARPPIVVTSLAGFCQATLPPNEFRNHTIAIRLEESVESRERLMSRLQESGYNRVDPVEDPGTFAVRGDIIDVFPPDRERPVRIELFGDMVEMIREFDPASQRAAADGGLHPREILMPPAREALINAGTAGRLREQVKARADGLGIPRKVRDPLLESIQSGIYPTHCDAWTPFDYASPASLLDYLPETAQVIWNDELSCLQEWDQFQAEQKNLSTDAASSGVIAPAPEDLFRWTPALEKAVRDRSSLFLDQIALADLKEIEKSGQAEDIVSDRHSVFVKPNHDLAAGSKHAVSELEPKLKLWLRQGYQVVGVATTQSQLERIRFLLEERGFHCEQGMAPQASLIVLGLGTLTAGFRWPAEGLAILTEEEILGARHARKQRRAGRSESGSAAREWSGLQALSDLSVGDAVVHADHGIGRYQGLVRLDLSGAPSDFLLLEYANRDRLYLPVYRLNVIQKYVGAGESVALDRLGSQQFARTKEKVKDAVKKLAVDLIHLYAERKVRPGVAFSPRDSLFREFEAKFPFDETPDQLKAIDAVLGDMESGRVMDRVVCGDVGYGKTEVAIRAAFRAVSDGKQVAVLVPTTVLAYQHEQSFRARLQDYPLVIESLSRFKTAREQKGTIEALAAGKVDIIIGTHRLLSRDIRFHDLGLIIVDEEHRFGVEHKERLKTLKVNTHVLTLTATPIPRTLHMALSGLRDISLINTAPVDRLPIRTYVSKFDESLIKRALEFELSRGGQAFFLHNRVQSIHETAGKLRELVPSARIAVAHGQMAEGELEKTMVSFYQKQTNVLVCTSIIESGLDLPSANTVVINRADSLGLAQLYQIRGRVGRGQNRAYAYLIIPAERAVTEDAKRRLEVIQKFVELGSGFSIASHDLEIRGGGDLLGPQQSGHIAAVGFDLYTELLEEAIREIEGKPISAEESRREPEIKGPFPAYLGEEYVPDVHQRLSLYRRFSAANQDAELDRLEEELGDRFGPLPPEAQNLLWLIRIKQLLKRTGVDGLNIGPEKVSLIPGPQSKLDPARAIALMASKPDIYQLTPDSRLVAKIAAATLRDLFFKLESLLNQLAA